MWAWVIGVLAVLLWGWGLKKAWDVMLRTGRNTENSQVRQRADQMYVSESEVIALIEQFPQDAAYPIKYAMMAGDNWPELKRRAEAVLKHHAHLIFGYTMLARAHAELGESAESQRITRRGLQRFPGDVELGIFAFHQAVAAGRNREALRIIRRLRLEHDGDGWMYATEVELLIKLARFAEAEALLTKADKHLSENKSITESWEKLEAATALPA